MKAFAGVLLVLLTAPVSSAPVSVHVTDENGAPVSAAKVWFEDSEQSIVKTAMTDAGGVAGVDLPVKNEAKYRGRYIVLKPGKSIGIGGLTEAAAEVKLAPAGLLTGRVVDAAGKPVAGAIVKINSYAPWRSPFLRADNQKSGFPWDIFSTRTDETGTWRFDIFGVGRKERVSLDDPRFAAVNGSFESLSGPPPPRPWYRAYDTSGALVAAPAVTLVGRVVDSAGKPAGGLRVEGKNENSTSLYDTTGDDGTFRLESGSAGTYRVALWPKLGDEKVAAPRTGLKAEAGQTVKVPDFVLTPGVIVEGRVIDSRTGAGATDVSVDVAGTPAQTDDEGRFKAHAPAGEGFVRVSSYPSAKYAGTPPDAYKLPPVLIKEGGTPAITLFIEGADPLVPVSARVVLENGEAATGVSLALYDGGVTTPLVVAPDGTIGFTPKDRHFAVTGSGEWIVVKSNLHSPTASERLQVTVRRTPVREASGKVVDEKGRGVAGAKVWVVRPEMLSPYSNRGAPASLGEPVFTDAGGTWRWTPKDADGRFLIKVEKAGYGEPSRGEVSPLLTVPGPGGQIIPNPNAEWIATDVVLPKLNRAYSGKVIDENGQPVAGASVSTDGSFFAVVTKADGTWELPEITQRGTKLFSADLAIQVAAGKGRAYGEMLVPADSASGESPPMPVLTLRPLPASPPDAATVQALVDKLVKDSAGGEALPLIQVVAMTDPERAARLALSLAPRFRGEASARIVQGYLGYEVKPDAARVARLLKALPAPLRGDSGITAATLLARAARAAAEDLFRREAAGLKAVGNCTHDELISRLRLAALAARLGLSQANGLADAAMDALVQRSRRDEAMVDFDLAIESAAAGGAAFASRAVLHLPVIRRNRARARALAVVARFDVGGASRLLEQIRVLDEKPGPLFKNYDDLSPASGMGGWGRASRRRVRLNDLMPLPVPFEEKPRMTPEAESYFASGALSVIKALGPKDATAALELARGLSPGYQGSAIAAAAVWQPHEKAVELLKELYLASANTESRHSIVRRFVGIRAADSEELVKEAEGRYLLESGGWFFPVVSPEIAALAVPLCPGEVRLKLESSLNMEQLLARASEMRAAEQGSKFAPLSQREAPVEGREKFALLMMQVDWERARELAARIAAPAKAPDAKGSKREILNREFENRLRFGAGEDRRRRRAGQNLDMTMAMWAAAPPGARAGVSIEKLQRQLMPFDGVYPYGVYPH